MRYIKPSLKIEEAQVVSMLAESLPINKDTTVDGGDALSKEDTWATWEDED
ncbi:MAG: hypothetical protein IKO73_06920 [Bacteroidaceae bacterium]|nr:hypothetical protein [Bacteroidaceae bacterium]